MAVSKAVSVVVVSGALGSTKPLGNVLGDEEARFLIAFSRRLSLIAPTRPVDSFFEGNEDAVLTMAAWLLFFAFCFKCAPYSEKTLAYLPLSFTECFLLVGVDPRPGEGIEEIPVDSPSGYLPQPEE